MRSVSALEVRQRFGALIDEAAAGERLIIERAGQPIAALVPLSDVPELGRDARVERQLNALADLRRLTAGRPGQAPSGDAAGVVRRERDARAQKVWQAIESWRPARQ